VGGGLVGRNHVRKKLQKKGGFGEKFSKGKAKGENGKRGERFWPIFFRQRRIT